jgi:hypothetical protein
MSGFHARGIVYIGGRDYMVEHVPGGVEAVTAAMPPDLRAFFSQIFLANTMYDVAPLVAISAAAASVSGVSHTEYVRTNAAWQAQRDIRGVYKLLLNVVSAELVALRLAKAAMRYFDFGEAASVMRTPTCCNAEQRGIPKPVAAWFTACVHGFVPVALTMAGAKNVRLRTLSTTSDGERHGVETVTVSYEFSWDDRRTLVDSPLPGERP